MRPAVRRALIVIAVILLAWLALAGLGLFTVERHTGFFAPVWDAQGDGIHYVERNSFGVVWGFGWEMFTPPAYSYVVRDAFALRHLELGASEPTTLADWSASPVEGCGRPRRREDGQQRYSYRSSPHCRHSFTMRVGDMPMDQRDKLSQWVQYAHGLDRAGASDDGRADGDVTKRRSHAGGLAGHRL